MGSHLFCSPGWPCCLRLSPFSAFQVLRLQIQVTVPEYILAVLEIESRVLHMPLPLSYVPRERSYMGFALGNLDHWAGSSQLLSVPEVNGLGKGFHTEPLSTLADTGVEIAEEEKDKLK